MGFSLGGALKGGLGGFLVGGPAGAFAGAALGGIAGGEAEDTRKDALRAANQGSQAAIAEKRRQFDLTRGDLLPFLEGGQQAQGKIFDLLAGGSDPLLQAQAGLAEKAAGRRASVLGGGAGTFQKDVLRGVSNLTNQRINQLLALRAGGQSAGTSLGSFGANAATGIGRNLQNIGQSTAGYNIGKANSIDNLLNQAAYAAPFIFNSSPTTSFSPGGAGAYGGF
jgi:hypothetical protein